MSPFLPFLRRCNLFCVQSYRITMFYQQFYMSFFNLLYKWGTDVMSANYEILRPVTPADLDVNPRFVKILKMIPREGHVTRDQFKSLETNAVNKCMIYAVSSGILKRVLIYERVLKLESVKFWCTQFNKTSHKRTSSNGRLKKYICVQSPSLTSGCLVVHFSRTRP